MIGTLLKRNNLTKNQNIVEMSMTYIIYFIDCDSLHYLLSFLFLILLTNKDADFRCWSLIQIISSKTKKLSIQQTEYLKKLKINVKELVKDAADLRADYEKQ